MQTGDLVTLEISEKNHLASRCRWNDSKYWAYRATLNDVGNYDIAGHAPTLILSNFYGIVLQPYFEISENENTVIVLIDGNLFIFFESELKILNK